MFFMIISTLNNENTLTLIIYQQQLWWFWPRNYYLIGCPTFTNEPPNYGLAHLSYEKFHPSPTSPPPLFQIFGWPLPLFVNGWFTPSRSKVIQLTLDLWFPHRNKVMTCKISTCCISWKRSISSNIYKFYKTTWYKTRL